MNDLTFNETSLNNLAKELTICSNERFIEILLLFRIYNKLYSQEFRKWFCSIDEKLYIERREIIIYLYGVLVVDNSKYENYTLTNTSTKKKYKVTKRQKLLNKMYLDVKKLQKLK